MSAAEKCTFALYGKSMIRGPYWRCSTCKDKKGNAICERCKDTCHAGHNVEQVGWAAFSGEYYCDCGADDGTYPPCQSTSTSPSSSSTSSSKTVDDHVTSAIKMYPPFKDATVAGNMSMIAGMLKDGRSTVFSPDNLRMACLVAGKAFSNCDSAIPYDYAACEGVHRAIGVFGHAPHPIADNSFPFSCPHKGAIDAATINQFVSDETKGCIPKIVTEESVKDAVCVIAAAIYFKGVWETPFDKNLTKTQQFTGKNGVVPAPMMFYDEGADFARSENFDSVSLPYENGQVKAIFTRLRNSHKATKLSELMQDTQLQREFAQAHLSEEMWTWHYASESRIMLPKFRIEATHSDLLELMLESGLNADIAKDLAVQIVHRAVIDVDEDGMVVAAATVVESFLFGGGSGPRVWVGDIPFLFSLVDRKSKSLLFCGLVDLST